MTDTVTRNINTALAKFARELEAERNAEYDSNIIEFASPEPEVNWDNPLGYFRFTGMFDGLRLGMELYDHARAYELRTTCEDCDLVAWGVADNLPPEFTPEMVKAIHTFEQWITNTEARK